MRLLEAVYGLSVYRAVMDVEKRWRTSDIDIVVILDELSAMDIRTYNAMLDTLPNREMICGFLSGKDDIMNWEPSDLFQFYYDTTPMKGSLDELLAVIDDSSEQ